MKKRNDDFDQIELLKESLQQQITQQEIKIQSALGGLRDNLTGAALINKFRENLFSGSGFAFKLGFLVVTLLQKKLSQRKKKKA